MSSCHFLHSDLAGQTETLLALWREWRKPENLAQPCFIVAPSYVLLERLKAMLLAADLPIFHVHFFQPPQLRSCLTKNFLPEAPPLLGREEYVFLLQQLAAPLASDFPLNQSLSRNASSLRSAADELTAAGHDISALLHLGDAPEGLAELLTRWRKEFPRWQSRDRAVRDAALCAARANRTTALSGQLLLFGFQPSDSAHFPLLTAALPAFDSAAVFTFLPAPGSEDLLQPWLQLVETALPHTQPALEQAQTEPDFFTTNSKNPAARRFYLTPNLAHTVDLIVRQAAVWLTDSATSSRYALVFPGPSALVAAVTTALRQRGLPFFSEFTTPLPLRFEQAILLDWIRLQCDGLHAESFLSFWRKIFDVAEFFQKLGTEPLAASALEPLLEHAFNDCLSEEVLVLNAWLQMENKAPEALARFLEQWNAEMHWPETASLDSYLKSTADQIDFLVGKNLGRQIRHFLDEELSSLAQIWPEPITRADFCQLLEGFVRRPEIAKNFTVSSPLFLISPASARGLPWDGLLLAPLNEGLWPNLDTADGLLDDSLREALNQRALRASPHAAGEQIFAPGFYPLLTSSQRHRLERGNFAELLESAEREIILVASAQDETGGAGELYPSEFFRQAWREARGTAWDETARHALLQAAPTLDRADEPRSDSVQKMAHAYHVRRDPDQPFSAFQFTHAAVHPARPLAAKAAEDILKDPATAWFKYGLKVRVERPTWAEEEVFARFQGTLLHRVLQRSLPALNAPEEAWSPRPVFALWQKQLSAALTAARQKITNACTLAGRAEPGWWPSEWGRLTYVAHRLLTRLDTALPLEFSHLSAEFNLRLTPSAAPQTPLQLTWSGRADLIALDAVTLREANRALIFDFKTGRRADDFKLKNLLDDAAYFQLVVYAALLRAAQPSLTHTSLAVIHRGGTSLAEPVEIDPRQTEIEVLWRVLHAAWLKGKWGQTRPVRERFRATSALPIATLEIPEHLLMAKWRATPELAGWERFRKED